MSAAAQRSPVVQAVAGYAVIIAVLFALLFLLRPVLLPLILSLLIAALLEPQVNRLVRMGLSDTLAITGLLLLTVALVAVFLYWVGPVLVEQMANLKSRLPQILASLNGLLQELDRGLEDGIDLAASVQAMSGKLEAWISSLIVLVAGGLAQGVVALLLVPVITFFLLRDYRHTRNRLLSLLPNSSFEKGCLIYFQITRQLQRYMRGVMIQSIIIAVLASIGFYAIGLEMALLFGLLSGLFNLIPYVGPLLSAIPPMLLLLGGTPIEPYMFINVIAVVLVVQAIDNLVVVPAFIASTVDLHPLLVMLGVIVAGSLFGFWGMLLAIPFLAVSKILMRDLYRASHSYVYAG